jgi:PTH1 family peptidyl-tRNA hydrolase
MNESGSSAGPARGSLGVPLGGVVVLHDEIDLPFGEVRSKLGGGLAGHNGLKSLGRGLGGPGFWRVRAGVGRPDTTDPEIVSSYVLSRFREPSEEVVALIGSAADEAERLVERLAAGGDGGADEADATDEAAATGEPRAGR